MKPTRPQIHPLRLLPSFLLLVTLTSGILHPYRVVGASFFNFDERVVTNRTQRADLPSDIKMLEVDNQFGAVRITATESGPFDWTWELTVKAPNDALARKGADAATCIMKTNGGRLQLTVSFPDSSSFNHTSFRSDLEFRVPKSLSVRTVNRFGPTTISGLKGDVEATGQNGTVAIQNIDGKVKAQTSFASLTVNEVGPASLKNQNGRIEASHIHGPLDAGTSFTSLTAKDIDGPVTLRNQNGGIEAAGVKGNADIKTSFARMSVERIAGDATLANQNGGVIARGITGSVKASTSFAPLEAQDIGGPVILRNQNGGIEASGIKGNADLKTSFGRLSAEKIAGDATLANQNGSVKAHAITGSVKANTSFGSLEVESSGPLLECHNQNGSIRLHSDSLELEKVVAETSFGSLEVHLPGGMKPVIRASTSFGKVDSDFPVLLKPKGQDPFAGAEPGVPRVSLQNQNGPIRIVRDIAVAGR